MNTAMMLHEVYRGPFNAVQYARIRDDASFFIDVVFVGDNYGMLAASTKDEVNHGIATSMLYHVRAIRHLFPAQAVCRGSSGPARRT